FFRGLPRDRSGRSHSPVTTLQLSPLRPYRFSFAKLVLRTFANFASKFANQPTDSRAEATIASAQHRLHFCFSPSITGLSSEPFGLEPICLMFDIRSLIFIPLSASNSAGTCAAISVISPVSLLAPTVLLSPVE